MAIVTMKRLTLLGMKSDKDKIYNAIIKSKLVELKRTADIDSCVSEDETPQIEKVLEKINFAEQSIAYVAEQADAYNAANKRFKDKLVDIPKGTLSRPKTEVAFDEFINFGNNAEQAEDDFKAVAELREEAARLQTERAQVSADIKKYYSLRNLPHPTTWYHDTDSSIVQLCQINDGELANLKKLAENYETVEFEVIDNASSGAVVAVAAHKSESNFFNDAAHLGLVKCGVVCEELPITAIKNAETQLNMLEAEILLNRKAVAEFAPKITLWKTYVDYMGVVVNKLLADGDLQKTWQTFVLEGYCPAEAENDVRNAIEAVSESTVLTFDDIGEDEYAPTLIKNNKVTEQFEYVTNMYTPPQYHEIDPNPVMSVFYFVIFGLMVADIGYGLLLVLAGLFAFFAIKQKTGVKTMLQLFGICGVSAMIVGALFGSFFSYPLYQGIIPDPSKYPMVMMILSLFVGIIHLCAGIACNMAVKIKHKRALSAWLADFPWIIVFVGLILAVFNMALDMAAYEPYNVLRLPDIVSQIALYVCLGALAVGVVFAGLGTKGFLGKAMKSFGSVYGIINYFSDIMSYIRVFGLMLSSALMGTVINQLGDMVMGNGGIGYVFAIILLVFAHTFNLVMGILGVYIHNGRLQYVEFFGKFYAGDGQLFTPFASETKYTLVKDAK